MTLLKASLKRWSYLKFYYLEGLKDSSDLGKTTISLKEKSTARAKGHLIQNLTREEQFHIGETHLTCTNSKSFTELEVSPLETAFKISQ